MLQQNTSVLMELQAMMAANNNHNKWEVQDGKVRLKRDVALFNELKGMIRQGFGATGNSMC